MTRGSWNSLSVRLPNLHFSIIICPYVANHRANCTQKTSNPLKSWEDRWFSFNSEQKILAWYKKESFTEAPSDTIDFANVSSVSPSEEKGAQFAFTISYKTDKKEQTLVLNAVTEGERAKWLKAFNDVLNPSRASETTTTFKDEAAWDQVNAATLQISAVKLEKKGMLNKSDPFFEISFNNSVEFRSEVVKSTQDPKWSAFFIHFMQLGGPNGIITITVWDFDETGSHTMIGNVAIETRSLFVNNTSFTILNMDRKSAGTLIVSDVKLVTLPPPVVHPAYEFHFSVSNFVKLDSGPTGKSDPFFMVYNSYGRLIYKSEVVQSTLNPTFKPFVVDAREFDGQLQTPLRIDFYDYDDDGSRDFGGSVNCKVRELLWNKTSFAITNNKKKAGVLTILNSAPALPLDAWILGQIPPVYKLKCSAKKLDRKDINLKSDPFMIVSKDNVVLYRSEVLEKNLNPVFNEFEIGTWEGWNKESELRFDVFDHDKDGGHDYIGGCQISLRELMLRPQAGFALKKKSGSSGCFTVDLLEPLPAYSKVPKVPWNAPAYKLSLSARKLAKKDILTQSSDPFFEVKYLPPGFSRGVTLYRSEVLPKNLNPDWKPFVLNVNSVNNLHSTFSIIVYDFNKTGAHEEIGRIETQFSDLLLGEGFSYPLSSSKHAGVQYLNLLREGKGGSGSVTFKLEPVPPEQLPIIPPAYEVSLKATNLDKKDLGSSDPYFTIRRLDGLLLYKSEIIFKNLNPTFKSFKLNVVDLGGIDGVFTLTVFDYDKNGDHDEIGSIVTTLREWSFGEYKVALINEEKENNIGYKSSGVLVVEKMVETTPDDVTRLPPAYVIKAKAQRLKKSDMSLTGGTSDPFFAIRYTPAFLDRPGKPANSYGHVTMYRSEVIQKNLNPEWKAFDLSVNSIGGTLDSKFDIEVYDWDRDGTHDLLGKATTTLREWTFSWVEISLRNEDGSTGAGIFVVERMEALSVDYVPIVPIGYNIQCSADKLARTDGPLSKSDPFFQFRYKPVGWPQEVTIHRSNVIKKSLSPKWEPFELGVGLIGGLDQPFTLKVYDWDADGSHDEIGEVTLTLREVCAGEWYTTAIRQGGSARGSFIIDRIYPLEVLQPQLYCPPGFKVWSSGMKLAKKDLGSSDPYFRVRYTNRANHQVITMYRSEVVLKNLNPQWKEWQLDLTEIGGLDVPFTIEVYDWDKDGDHDLIGSLTTTAREWTFGPYQQGLLSKHGNAAGAFSVDGIAFLDSTQKRVVPAAYKLECSASKLARKDGPLGKSDPYFEVKAQPPGFSYPITLHRSEVVMKNLAPTWTTPCILNVDDLKGIDNPFEIRVYDYDADGAHDLIGKTTTTLRELTCGISSYQLPLFDDGSSSSSGAFSVDYVTPVPQENRPVPAIAYSVKAKGVKLDAKDANGSSDPYFEIKAQPSGYTKAITLYRSEVVMKNKNPSWNPFQINLRDIHGLDTQFTINVYDYDEDGGHDLIGTAHITFREWTFGAYSIPLINPDKKGRIGYSSSGAFYVEWIQPLDQESIREYPAAFRITAGGAKLDSKDLAPGSSSDPFFVVRCRPPGFYQDITVHRSNVIKNNLNPQWNSFELAIETVRGLDTEFEVSVYDWDKDGNHDLIGILRTTLREWTFGTYRQPLVNPSKQGRIGYQTSGAFVIQTVEPLTALQQKVIPPAFNVQFTGMKIARKDLASQSDPFFRVKATPPGYNHPITIFRSSVQRDTKTPTWEPFILNVSDVKGLDSEFSIEVYDADKDGGHDYLGVVTTTLREWTFVPESGDFSMAIRPTRDSSSSNGALIVHMCNPADEPQYRKFPPAYLIHPSGSKLSSGNITGNDPFFKITAKPEGFTYPITIYRSEVIDKNSDPKWNPFTLNVSDVRGIDTEFEVSVYDFNKDGEHDLIGSCKTTLRELAFPESGRYLIGVRRQGKSGCAGAWAVDTLENVSQREIKTYPVAYSIKPAGAKISRKDVLGAGKSDPFFKVTAKPEGFSYPITIYRSEVAKSTSEPQWNEFTLNVDDVRGLDTPFTISVYDWDKDGGHDLVGTMSTTLREWTFVTPYSQAVYGSGSSSKGAFIVAAVTPLQGKQVKSYAPAYKLTVSASQLDKKDGPLGKSDPFFEVKYIPKGYDKAITLYRSEVIKKELNPKWQPFELSVEMLGGIDVPFDVIVYDFDDDGGHDLIGSFSTTYREWTFGPVSHALVHPEKEGRVGYSSSGAFSIDKTEPLEVSQIKQYPVSWEVKTSGNKFSRINLLEKPDTYFEIFAELPGRPRVKLYRSEVMVGDVAPSWKPFILNVADIGTYDTPFLVQCWDWNRNGTKELIGEFRTTLREWTFGRYSEALVKPDKSSSSGAFVVETMTPRTEYTARLNYAPAFDIRLCAKNITGKDSSLTGKSSDPFFRMTVKPPGFERAIPLYRSEYIEKSGEPQWRPFKLNVVDVGGLDVPIKIEVFDSDTDGGHDFIGELETTLREFTFSWFEQAIVNPKKTSLPLYRSSGVLYVDAMKPLADAVVKVYPPAYTVKAGGARLDKKDLLSKSDPFFEIKVAFPGFPEPLTMYRSEVVKDNSNPGWNTFDINVGDFGGLDKPFTVNVYDYDTDGNHPLVGSVTSTLREWTFAPLREGLINSEKVGRIGYQSSGAFCPDALVPLPEYKPKPVAPAYQITVKGTKLDSKDGLLGKSDPFFVVQKIYAGYSQEPLTLYKSEVIKQNLNPEWKPFELDVVALGGIDSPFTVVVYDWDADAVHEEIGRFTTTIREWTFGSYTHALINSKKKGRIGYSSSGGFTVVKADALEAAKENVFPPAYTFTTGGFKLERKDVLGVVKSDPFFVVRAKSSAYGQEITLYRSEVVKNTTEPKWSPFQLSVAAVGGVDNPFFIYVYDHDQDGGHDLIGVCRTTIRELSFTPTELAIINPSKKSRIGYRSSGAFMVTQYAKLKEDQIVKYAPAYKIHAFSNKLDRKDFLGKSDAFFEVRRQFPSFPRSTLLYRSETVSQSLSPQWAPFDLSLTMTGGLDVPITITVYDHNENGAHVEIGSLETTVREWTFQNYSQALISKKYKGRSDYKSSGAFGISKAEPLESDTMKALPLSYKVSAWAQELDNSGDCYYEIFALSSGGKLDRMLYRSERSTEKLPKWNAVELPLSWIGSLDHPLKFKVVNRNKDFTFETVGSLETSLRELSFGSTKLALYSKKKAKRNPRYKSSGAFAIDKLVEVNEIVTQPVSAYTFRIHCVNYPSKKGAAKDKRLTVISHPLDASDKNIIIYDNHWINDTWIVTIPLEAVGGLDVPVKFQYYKGSFKATLRELASNGASFNFSRKKKQLAFLPKKKHIVAIANVDDVKSIEKPFAGYSVTFHGNKLDSKDGISDKSDPFFVISAEYPNTPQKVMLYNSETKPQTLNPEFQAFRLELAQTRDWDNTLLIVDVFDFDPSGQHDHIGSFTTTLRELGTKKSFAVINQFKKDRLTTYFNSGVFVVQDVSPIYTDAMISPPFGLTMEKLRPVV